MGIHVTVSIKIFNSRAKGRIVSRSIVKLWGFRGSFSDTYKGLKEVSHFFRILRIDSSGCLSSNVKMGTHDKAFDS